MTEQAAFPEIRAVEFRDAELAGSNFRGYAAVFDSPWAQDLIDKMGYSESIARGAFRKALGAVNAGDYNVPLTWQHDRNSVLATTRAGTLKLKEDGRGLVVDASLPNTTLGRDVRELIERGDVGGMSYGIETIPSVDSRMSRQNGVIHRSISNVRKLIDTTLTWEPSYPDTSVELRSQGFAALPLQEILDGSEEQIEEAVTGTSSRVAIPSGRFSDFELAQIEKGGWPV